MIFLIAMGAEYLSYVKSIATFAPTFYGYIISVLASVYADMLCICRMDSRGKIQSIQYSDMDRYYILCYNFTLLYYQVEP